MIQTIKKRMPSDNLGVTYFHEHLLFLPPEPFASQDQDLRLYDVEAAIEEVESFKRAGGNTIVEMSTVEMGRDPTNLERISDATGVNIIAATGYNKGKFCERYIGDREPYDLAREMIKDLTEGMGETKLLAGLIKISTSKNEVLPVEDKVIKAAIIAQRETGAPVSTHTEAGTMALDQIEYLVKGGIPPEQITIGHVDRLLDIDYLSKIANTGVYLGFDQISKEKYYPDAVRISVIQQLIDSGHGKQILLSGDLARMSYWPAFGFGNGPGLTYILWRFVPWMLEARIAKSSVIDMLVNNPAKALTWSN